MKDYLKTYLMSNCKDSEIDLLLKYYPNDQRAGCPFNTGIKNGLGKVFVCPTESAHCLCSRHERTRPAIQAHGRHSGRFRIPRPASILLEEQSRQAKVVGVQYVVSPYSTMYGLPNDVLRSI